MKIHGLVLAAGESKRLGQPKQLLIYKEQTLIQNIIGSLRLSCDEVSVVLGANIDQIRPHLSDVVVIENKKWYTGMGSSLMLGTHEISQLQHIDAILVAVCDQPLIPKSHYQELVRKQIENPDKIIVSAYQGITGVPAIFPTHYLANLKNLNNSRGAQAIINNNTQQVIEIICDEAANDVDTQADLVVL